MYVVMLHQYKFQKKAAIAEFDWFPIPNQSDYF